MRKNQTLASAHPLLTFSSAKHAQHTQSSSASPASLNATRQKNAETRVNFPYDCYAARPIPHVSSITTDLPLSRFAAVRPVNATPYDGYVYPRVVDDLVGTQRHDEVFWRPWFLRGRGCGEREKRKGHETQARGHEALKIAIGDRLRVDRAHAKYLKAHFETSPHDGGLIMGGAPFPSGALLPHVARFPPRPLQIVRDNAIMRR
jgi:hypothetical protein